MLVVYFKRIYFLYVLVEVVYVFSYGGVCFDRFRLVMRNLFLSKWFVYDCLFSLVLDNENEDERKFVGDFWILVYEYGDICKYVVLRVVC